MLNHLIFITQNNAIIIEIEI